MSTNNREVSFSPWRFVTPRDELAPAHELKDDGKTLVLQGSGDRHAIGCWQSVIELKAGRWYRAGVRIKWQNLDEPHLSIFAQAGGHFLVPAGSENSAGATAGDWPQSFVLQCEFQFRPETQTQPEPTFEVFLKATAHGRVEYSQPHIEQIPAPPPRMARVATVRFGDASVTPKEQLAHITKKLDEAGAFQPDIVALPEWAPLCGVPGEYWNALDEYAEAVPDGATCRVLSTAARKYKMYVLAGLLERRGKYLFNTAVIFDRNGEFVGQYDKTHLTLLELRSGVSCGDSYPLFDLDFGRIAIHICYDEWFPEVSRYYAHSGAEILFLPVAGGKPITWRTRALDNRVYFVASSVTPPSMIINSTGAIIAESDGDGIACANLNLNDRQTNVYGDPTLADAIPCLAPQMRHCLDDQLLHDLHRMMTSSDEK